MGKPQHRPFVKCKSNGHGDELAFQAAPNGKTVSSSEHSVSYPAGLYPKLKPHQPEPGNPDGGSKSAPRSAPALPEGWATPAFYLLVFG